MPAHSRILSFDAAPFYVSALVCAVFLYVDFLSLEDASLLFNRSNHLPQAPLFFYYNGYISATPQLISRLASGAPPVAQAAIYAASSLLIWSCMLHCLRRISESAWVPLLIVLYFAAFRSVYFYNLTYALWPALACLGLFPLMLVKERRRLKPHECAIMVACSFASPLSLMMLPVLLAALHVRRDDRLLLIAALAAATSFAVLRDPDHARAGLADIVPNLLGHLGRAVDQPGYMFRLSGGRAPISPARLCEWLALLAAALWAARVAVGRHDTGRDDVMLAAFGACGIAILLLSIGTQSMQVEAVLFTRNWFVLIVAGALVAWRVMARRARVLAAPLAAVLGVIAVNAIYGAAAGCAHCRADVAALMGGHDRNVVIDRKHHGGGPDWSIALGSYGLTVDDCASTHEDGDYDFRIPCTGTAWIYYTR